MTVGDVANRKTAHVAYYVVVGLLAVIGLSVLGYRLVEGMKVTSLTSSIPWGMWVSAYIYFVGLSAGSFLLSTLIYVFNMRQFERIGRIALLSAFFSLTAALLFIWIDLGHPWRAWEMIATPHWTSVMTIEGWLYIVYMAIIVAELWLLMRADLARLAEEETGFRQTLYRLLALGHEPRFSPEAEEASEKATRRWVTVLSIVGVPTAIAVHGGTGSIFAVAVARPYWSSPLMPIVFLVSALVSGTALVTFIYAFFGRRDAE
ncbi:MAG: NrfD/PsrC family molybdoenzyme membrane anchor subunit, partial [Dehalococcoidia bacterium]